MFPGVSSLVISEFGLKPPASGFQSYSYSSLRLLHLYSTDDKTSRLMMKSFSTVMDTGEVHRVTWRREEGGGRQRWPGGEDRESKGERAS